MKPVRSSTTIGSTKPKRSTLCSIASPAWAFGLRGSARSLRSETYSVDRSDIAGLRRRAGAGGRGARHTGAAAATRGTVVVQAVEERQDGARHLVLGGRAATERDDVGEADDAHPRRLQQVVQRDAERLERGVQLGAVGAHDA